MISVLRTNTNQKNPGHEDLSLDTLRHGSWINLVTPTRQELEDVARIASVPLNFLTAAMDAEESSRIDVEEADEDSGCDTSLLMVLNIPKHPESFSFDTLPLGIVITESAFITVCLEENVILPGAAGGVRGFCTWKHTRFLLQILYRTAGAYLQYLSEINRMSNSIEHAMRQSLQNEELFRLMDLEKGLTYFTGSIRSNRVAIDKLLRVLKNPQYQELVKMRVQRRAGRHDGRLRLHHLQQPEHRHEVSGLRDDHPGHPRRRLQLLGDERAAAADGQPQRLLLGLPDRPGPQRRGDPVALEAKDAVRHGPAEGKARFRPL